MAGKVKNILYAALTALCIASCGGRAASEKACREADSLNRLSYEMRYKDLALSAEAAGRAFKLAGAHATLRAEALNNMGFCAFMQMDFEQASRLFRRAAAEGDSEIERLVADVGMMKICQRTSKNKEFYDYRNSALRRMDRIREDEALITDPHEKQRLHYACSEFYIISGIYYYYLRQRAESLQSIDAITEEMLGGDKAQKLYYDYMRGSGGMYEAATREEVIAGEFRYLANCLLGSRAGGYVYFEANALQGMAELLNFRENRKILETHCLGILRLVNEQGLALDSLPLCYARRALSLFKQYGDWYQTSGAYRTIATYYAYAGQPERALPNLNEALQYVNRHHEKFYHCPDTADRLRTYVPDAGRPTELKWIADEGIMTIPEWILRLREQLSRTYSALGCKKESDYNRNIYLDLLDYTRQDKALESRYAALERDSKQLNFLLSLVFAGFFVLVVLFVLLNRRWRKRNRQYLSVLRQVLELCRKVTSAVPVHAQGMDEVVESLQQTVREDFLRIFGAGGMCIRLCCREAEEAGGGEDCLPEGYVPFDYPLVSPGRPEPVGVLSLALPRPLPKEKSSLLRLVLPYLAWTLENGVDLVSLDDERRRAEKEQYVHGQHLAENKRQNIVKKACFSIVTGILPYIDRVINEVHKLESASYARQEQVKRGKFAYIDELITRINEYNDILAVWIKMRQGALSLNIENFALDELFAMVAKGKRSFEMKHQELVVLPTDAVVKADRALTLFMINTLAENARKYTPEGGRVELSATVADGYVEVSVSDNGMGLSAEDVRRILGEKVYDSAEIGTDIAADVQELRKQKGHGFGLMNCKGIIEKYRKTNPVFSVCRFDVDSVPGKGSRFYFRLPKGVKKAFGFLLLSGLLFAGSGCGGRQVPQADAGEAAGGDAYDSLLVIANDYANLVYDCNVNACYHDALAYADSALSYLNAHYLRYSGADSPLLSLYDKNYDVAEQAWLARDFDTDYYILLDVRNEVAVAALAVKDFRAYYYNNMAYTVLYKQLSEDHSLEQYCVQMQQSANNKTIALVLFVLVVLASLAGYYLLYLRHRLHYRYNMEQVFAVNRAVFSLVRPVGQDVSGALAAFSDEFFTEMNELLPIKDMALSVYDEETAELHLAFSRGEADEELYGLMQRSFAKRRKTWGEGMEWSCFPLMVEVGGESHCAGVLALRTAQLHDREEDKLLVELVVGYLAVALYNKVVRVKRKFNDLELAQDDARRVSYEENMLHVQNMVLDNCLSTIKHETIYYPNRIKQIVDRLNRGKDISPEEERAQLQVIGELVNYYKEIFALLSSCAARQLDEVTFRRSDIDTAEVVAQAAKYLHKVSRRLPCRLELETEVPAPLVAVGDRVLLSFLLENLIDEAARFPQAGVLRLSVCEDNGFARFSFTDTRRSYKQEALNELFYPSLARMRTEGGNELAGTEYLVCKQVVRDHDEYAGRRGCRINAVPHAGGGFTVWFTIPLKQGNKQT